MQHGLAECPPGRCACDCFTTEMHDAITARAKKFNLGDLEMAAKIMTLGLAVIEIVDSGTLPKPAARKSKLSGVGV